MGHFLDTQYPWILQAIQEWEYFHSSWHCVSAFLCLFPIFLWFVFNFLFVCHVGIQCWYWKTRKYSSIMARGEDLRRKYWWNKNHISCMVIAFFLHSLTQSVSHSLCTENLVSGWPKWFYIVDSLYIFLWCWDVCLFVYLSAKIVQYTTNIIQYTAKILQYIAKIRLYTAKILQYTAKIIQYTAKVIIVYYKDTTVYCKDNTVYCKDTTVYCKDNTVYYKDAAVYCKYTTIEYCKDNTLYCKDYIEYCKDNAVYCKDYIEYSKDNTVYCVIFAYFFLFCPIVKVWLWTCIFLSSL